MTTPGPFRPGEPGPDAPLTEQELQDYLDHLSSRASRLTGDASGPVVDAAAVERRLARQPEARAALDLYRQVWTALGAEPAAFAPGFADRVAARLVVEPVAAREGQPWVEHLLLALVVLVGFVTAFQFRDVLGETWLGAAAPVLVVGLAVLGLAEAADRLLLHRGAGRSRRPHAPLHPAP